VNSRRLDRLRTIIARREHWVFASDNPQVAYALRALAAVLALKGATRDDVALMEVEHRALLARERIDLTLCIVSKSQMSALDVAEVVGDMCGPLARAEVARGCDVFPLSRDPERIGGVLDSLARGKCFVPRPERN
jgi:hypothetical protein